MTEPTTPLPMLLDCDPGHDDALAMMLAAGHPGVELLAVTTVAGNGTLEDTTRNARVVLTVAGVRDVPVAAGCDRPLAQELRTAPDIHGDNALGGPTLPAPEVPLDPRHAVDLMAELLRGRDHDVALVATGPITNVATLLQRHPEAAAGIKEIVWMGGSAGRGNVAPLAEFNALTDPEALDAVLGRGLPFTMVGLDVTHQAATTAQVVERFRRLGTRSGTFAAELMDFFRASYAAAQRMPDAPLHDPVAAARAMAPALVTCVPVRLDVELEGRHTRGATVTDLAGVTGRPVNAQVATDIDVDGFWRLLLQACASLA